MPSFPITPTPRSVGPLPYARAAFTSQFDGGAIATRAKFLRRRVVGLRLQYLLNNDELFLLSDFWASVAGQVLTFDFTYPYTTNVTIATDATPIVITTFARHGLQTGEQAVISDVNANANGVQTVTRISAHNFSLDGTTSGAGTASSGTVARYFPTMRFMGDQFGPFEPLMGFGAPQNDGGLIPVVVTLEEGW